MGYNTNKKKNILVSSFKYSIVFIVIFWLVELLQTLGFNYSGFGIYPREKFGLIGIITSPFIHGDLQHLLANTIPFFILSFFLFVFYRKRSWVILFIIWLTTGVFTWVIGRDAWHIGASGIIYGLATFLVLGGILSRNWKLILVSILVLTLYSGLIWGVFPADLHISWEGHLSGALSGALSAILYRRKL